MVVAGHGACTAAACPLIWAYYLSSSSSSSSFLLPPPSSLLLPAPSAVQWAPVAQGACPSVHACRSSSGHPSRLKTQNHSSSQCILNFEAEIHSSTLTRSRRGGDGGGRRGRREERGRTWKERGEREEGGGRREEERRRRRRRRRRKKRKEEPVAGPYQLDGHSNGVSPLHKPLFSLPNSCRNR